ncbi:MAG: hypothetical protein R3E53_17695 [Myxococcota bacterium]
MAVLAMLLEDDRLHVEAAGVGLMARAALQVLLGVAATGDGLADMA